MIDVKNLTPEQRRLTLQRLTALWAFSESGLGGVLHALQVPFTGLVVGGLAIILISFIGYIAPKNSTELLKSLVLVLLVKAVVSPHTPFPAYIAVGFQGLLGFGLFRLFRVNLITILFFSVTAMIESAVQKLLILTLFFGQSFWKATDELIRFIGKQFSVSINAGSYWLIGLYILIYFIGGVVTAVLTYRLIFSQTEAVQPMPQYFSAEKKGEQIRRSYVQRFTILLLFAVVLSIILFFFDKQPALAMVKPIVWTLTAILVWYGLLTPLFSRLLQSLLQKNRNKYNNQLNSTLALLPVFRTLTTQAWINSKTAHGWRRVPLFLRTLLSWSLTYTES
ncbi:MAG: hypothetical protein JWP88_1846 [Flaviaesturariibacter sp.]|nr:hypothetical protein [Flaviaesturariibacter sp.]